MGVSLTLRPLGFKRVPVFLKHEFYERWVGEVLIPDNVALFPSLGPKVSFISGLVVEMNAKDHVVLVYNETASIHTHNYNVNLKVAGLGGTLNYLSTNPTVAAAQREAAKRLRIHFRPLRNIAHYSQSDGAEKVKDILGRMMQAPLHTDVVTIGQETLIQQIIAENATRMDLFFQRQHVQDERTAGDSMSELCDKANPTRLSICQDLEFYANNGTDEQQARAQTMLFDTNSIQNFIRTRTKEYLANKARKKAGEATSTPDQDGNQTDEGTQTSDEDTNATENEGTNTGGDTSGDGNEGTNTSPTHSTRRK